MGAAGADRAPAEPSPTTTMLLAWDRRDLMLLHAPWARRRARAVALTPLIGLWLERVACVALIDAVLRYDGTGAEGHLGHVTASVDTALTRALTELTPRSPDSVNVGRVLIADAPSRTLTA